MQSIRQFCQILNKLQVSREGLEKYADIKFHKSPSRGGRAVQRGRTDKLTDITKLRSFSNATKNVALLRQTA